MSPVKIVHLLADVGAYGVNFHDNNLVPIDATPTERESAVAYFKVALKLKFLAILEQKSAVNADDIWIENRGVLYSVVI